MSEFTPLIASLPSSVPFVGPETLERRSGAAIQARIGANENVFGPAPSVIQAMQDHVADVWKYGDPENHDLKQALAAHLGVAPENICVGEGIDGLFGYALRLFVEPGVTVATSLGAYPTFNFHAAGFGGRLVTTPYVEDREDPASLLDLVKRENARVVYLANPDNPMGTVWPAANVQRFIDALPETTMLMLDEAYTEFAPPGTQPPLDVTRKNVLRFRTFSKAYGLAGMRVGYVIGEAETIKAFDKIRNHFGMTRLSQVAGLVALKDQAWLQHVVTEVSAARERIYSIARAHNFAPIRSATNFVAVDCGKDGAYAKSLVDSLLQHGVFVRMPGVAPLNRCIRISAGKKEQLDLLEAALSKLV
ncbi:pyridoxal phosphate-dependent aminotransferase [Aestuariivirga litoralis]|uniref:pyridoxal phosphate-dependent aminotransferase n=1 Tax=Aestuariivirga litoralis TaxID=2650924 RepID=UPI0018C58123|nr:pyridoxal phosphate-dependent aminotransferase [Aestuariivirga litoralis]MBG1232706.1 pyridoxal phosphate-dependent aminotransferase [Aestuariivirga litoralis]